MTTTNGTRAILASREVERVGLAAMSNAPAAIEWVESWGRDVHIVCAGTDGRISWEDTLLSGEVADRLQRHRGYVPGNDEALIAASVYGDAVAAVRAGGSSWPDVLARGRGGRRVREIGLRKDIEAAARRHTSDVVPVLEREPLRIVRSESTGGR
jgi:2-phosphosulfolactate phosphatase